MNVGPFLLKQFLTLQIQIYIAFFFELLSIPSITANVPCQQGDVCLRTFEECCGPDGGSSFNRCRGGGVVTIGECTDPFPICQTVGGSAPVKCVSK